MRPLEYFTLPPPFTVMRKIARGCVIHCVFRLTLSPRTLVILRSPPQNVIRKRNAFYGGDEESVLMAPIKS
jgi:hypothetical protein